MINISDSENSYKEPLGQPLICSNVSLRYFSRTFDVQSHSILYNSTIMFKCGNCLSVLVSFSPTGEVGILCPESLI